MRKRTAENLMMLLLCFSFVFLFRASTVNAARMEEAEEYELGTVFQGKLTFDEGVRYFRFVIPERSRVTLYLERSGKGCEGAVYNKTGSEMMKKADLEYKTDYFTGWSSASLSRILVPGTYYLEIRNHGKWSWQKYKFSFCIQAEKEIKLNRGVIRSLESPTEGELTVICEKAEYAIGYRIQYATDERLREGVKTVCSSTRVKTLKNLKKGERYYIRVCPYTVYEDGTFVYGQNSYTETIVIRKN
ncbi:hypothetical protein C805_00101 [Eubacterium sp. 14-2]|nr:hypothetical protein C805_00101 [Eubacterium sp. 14-2]